MKGGDIPCSGRAAAPGRAALAGQRRLLEEGRRTPLRAGRKAGTSVTGRKNETVERYILSSFVVLFHCIFSTVFVRFYYGVLPGHVEAADASQTLTQNAPGLNATPLPHRPTPNIYLVYIY